MVSKISNGVKISVEVSFQEDISDVENQVYWFAYQIKIQNLLENDIQLQTRKWYIFDSSNEKKQVEGAGVVGLMPIISKGGIFTYTSACNLTTAIGEMHGYYTFLNANGEIFEVEIPSFLLMTKHLLN